MRFSHGLKNAWVFRAIPQTLVGTVVPALLHHTVDLMIIVFNVLHYFFPQGWFAGLSTREVTAASAQYFLPELPGARRQ